MDRRQEFLKRSSMTASASGARFLPDLPPAPWQQSGQQPTQQARQQNGWQRTSAPIVRPSLTSSAPASVPQSLAEPDWFRAAGRAPAMAVGVVAGLYLVVTGIATGGSAGLMAVLAASAIAWSIRRSWRKSMYGTPNLTHAGAQATTQSVVQTLIPMAGPIAVTAPRNAVLLKAYLRAFFAYFSTFLLLSALAQGIAPQTGLMSRIGMFLPTLYLALMMLGALRWAVLALVRAAEQFGVRRGIADCAIGALLGGIYLAVDVIAAVQLGVFPSQERLVGDLIQITAGGMAGFEFWRAVGAPGASRRVATLLARFKNGLLIGLRRGI